MARADHQTPGFDWAADWPHLLKVWSGVGGVAGVLILGALLQSDAAEEGPDTAERPRPEQPAIAAVPSERDLDLLSTRAERDLGRIASGDGAWTAQLLLLCDREQAREMIDRFDREPRIYFLPALHEDRACFRVCWGRYDTADQARAASDRPGAVKRLQPEPFPRRVGELGP